MGRIFLDHLPVSDCSTGYRLLGLRRKPFPGQYILPDTVYSRDGNAYDILQEYQGESRIYHRFDSPHKYFTGRDRGFPLRAGWFWTNPIPTDCFFRISDGYREGSTDQSG